VQDSHANTYAALGEWVRACYGTPLASTSGSGYVFELPATSAFVDRVQIIEDTALGQRVRSYSVEAQPLTAPANASWTLVAAASAIGRKRIHLFDPHSPFGTGYRLRLKIERAVATPQIRFFGAFAPCAKA